MNAYTFDFCGTRCIALPSGALHLPDHNTLCVSDLHLGKSERIARRSGVMLPPYEVHETVQKLEAELAEIKQQKSQVEQRLQSIKEAEYTELLFILRALGNNELSEKLERELGTGAMIAPLFTIASFWTLTWKRGCV